MPRPRHHFGDGFFRKVYEKADDDTADGGRAARGPPMRCASMAGWPTLVEMRWLMLHISPMMRDVIDIGLAYHDNNIALISL